MRKLRITLTLLLILISTNKLRSQNLNAIVNNIAKINEVQFYGQSGKYENFENFELLKKKSNITQLLKLIEHKNSVVACYSSFALIDKNYNQIHEIFTKLLLDNKKVTTLGGCIEAEDEISALFYEYFISLNKLSENEKNKVISKLDSISIHIGNSNRLINKALEKKVNDNYNQQIKYLAYQKYNKDALFYISNWNIETDKETLKNGWLNYIDKTEISSYFGFYYSTIEKLLDFKDDEINAKILSKLKNNKEDWKYDKETFEKILSEHNLKID
jgi:hypothetical protein